MPEGNSADILRAMQERIRDTEACWRKGTVAATAALIKRSRERMREGIYNKPVPKVKRTRGKHAGKPPVPKWERAGGAGLRGAERHRIPNAYEGHVYNDMPYALARHNLGLSAGDKDVIGPPPKKKRKTTRQAPWRAQAIRDTAKQRLEAYRGELFEALEQGK